MNLSVTNLTKSYGQKKVVNNLSFNITSPSITGFIGANGAGKTSVIRMILRLLIKDYGRVLVSTKNKKKEIDDSNITAGAVLDKPAFVPYLTGRQNLILAGDICNNHIARIFHHCSLREESKKLIDKQNEANWTGGILSVCRGQFERIAQYMSCFDPRSRMFDEICGIAPIDEQVSLALNRTNLEAIADDKIATYSTGMIKRLAIAYSIIHNPYFLFLDEPFEGLDPESRVLLKTIINEQYSSGKAVFISSHQLAEIEDLCTDLIFIHNGSLVYKGSVEELTGKSNNPVLFTITRQKELELSNKIEPLIKNYFSDIADTIQFTEYGFSVVTSPESIPAIVTCLTDNNIPLYGITEHKRTLCELYLTLRDSKTSKIAANQLGTSSGKQIKSQSSTTVTASGVYPQKEPAIQNQTQSAANRLFSQVKTSFRKCLKYEIIKILHSPGKTAILFLPSLLPLLLCPLLCLSPVIFSGFRAKYILPALSGSFSLSLSFARYVFPVLCAIIVADSFATEKSRGVIDTVLLTGITRTKLFAAKVCSILLWVILALTIVPLLYGINITLAWYFLDAGWWNAYNLPLISIGKSLVKLLFFYFTAQAAIVCYWLLFSVQSESFAKSVAKGMIPLTCMAVIGSLSNEICSLLGLTTNPAPALITVQYSQIGDFDLLDNIFNHGLTPWPPCFFEYMLLLLLQGITLLVISLILFNRQDFNGGKN